MIALHTTIHNRFVSLLSDSFFCNIMINPIGVSPHGRIYLAKFYRRACVVANRFFECRVEVAVIEEDVGIVEPPIEMPFH